MVGYGTVVPDGRLPVYSVDTEEEARLLIAATCQRSLSGQYIAPELAQDQTLENLYAFGVRIHEAQRRFEARRKEVAAELKATKKLAKRRRQRAAR